MRKGHYLAGDKDLRPKVLDRVLALGGMEHFIPPSPPPHGPGRPPPPDPTRFDPLSLAAVNGGYVAFVSSTPLLFVSLVPYWRIVLTIAILAMGISWYAGRLFASRALQPIEEVSSSLEALAGGDYTQRRFIMKGGDEVASLTQAYNDAAASVAAVMDDRRRAEERMRQFAADASHELRTPLTVIGGYLDVLRQGRDRRADHRATDPLHHVARERAHAESDRPAYAACPPRLRGTAARRRDRRRRIPAGQCEAARRLDDHRVIDYSIQGVRTIEADRSELGEAIWNIVENALKYAPEAPIHLGAAVTMATP